MSTTAMPPLQIAPNQPYGRARIAERIRAHAQAHDNHLDLLEAGCGREWNIDVGGIDVRMTGIDLDAKALSYRRDEVGDLDEAIVGDLREVELPAEGYDVVFSAFVLEHIAGAQDVLDKMVAAVRPGGLLILRVPDGAAVYAFLARTLPHWTHVLYKRISEHDPMAGKPGHPPYVVVYDPIVTREGLRRYFESHGLEVLDEFGTNPHITKLGRLAPVGMGVQRSIASLSRGRLDGSHSNLTYIIRVP